MKIDPRCKIISISTVENKNLNVNTYVLKLEIKI